MTDSAAVEPAPQPGVDPHRVPAWWGVVVGLIAAGAGLAAGQFVAGFSRFLRSPVVSVGDRVIDRVPKALKEWAIRSFGTSDKTVLVWTIVIIVAIAAAVVGFVTVRGRTEVGIAFAVLFAVLGAWAGGVGRNTRFIGVFPSVFAGLVAAAVLIVGRRLTQPRVVRSRATMTGARVATAQRMTVTTIDRRRFLFSSAGIALGAIAVESIGKGLQNRFNTALERAGVRLPTPAKPLPAPPADPATTTAGLSPLITPIANFYRIDTALSFPSVSLKSWRLNVTGLVNTPRTYTYDELLNRDLIERDITISCVSNEVGGDLVGNARWIGCRLDDLLHEAGIKSGADQIMGVSVDEFTAGFPVATLDGRDAIVALGMNGEALPVKNGFPARLIVPGLYGYVSATKWLSEIRLTRFDQEQGYWIPRGWSTLAPVKTESRIDRPGAKATAGAVAIAGVAWAPTRGIKHVEVQVDDGPWTLSTLGPTLGDDSWRQWFLKWDATPGQHQIRCRATDGTGTTQTEDRADVAPDGATGWHTIRVNVAG
jgi:DMSO/TMAO reductase YedYZ molybdopterin-dependent catalytic subunit